MKTNDLLLKENVLVKHYAGSHAYGMALPTSDVDIRGIFCAEPVNIRTPFFPVREVVDTKDEDTKFYELSHFMKLCLECNPNIIETLWTENEDIISRTEAYNHLRLHRTDFLSSKIAFTTSGYAHSQLHRIKGHEKWISNPQPKEPPKPYQYLSMVQWFGNEKLLKPDWDKFRQGHRLIPYGNNIFGLYEWKNYNLWDEKGNLNTNFEGDRTELGLPLMVVQWNKQEYQNAKEKHKQYWNWKKNRNQKRSELEEKFHFDTKHASHLVRLLRMGLEALKDGVINVKRPDADELLDIRNGKWTYNEIIEYAEHMENQVLNVWYKKTHLPKKPNIKLASKVLMEVQDIVWDNKKYE